MDRRLALVALIGCLCFSLAPQCSPQPNVILIITDDQRWDTLAYMPEVQARLVAQGISFDQAFVTTPLCCPSRASFLTGKYARNHGVLRNGGPQGGAATFHANGEAESTIGVWMRQAGYVTGYFGKYLNGYAAISPLIPPGWDDWQAFASDVNVYFNYVLNENGTHVPYGSNAADYSTDVLRDRAVEFVQAHAGERFFLVFAPFAPHLPAIPAPRHAGSFAGEPPWRPASFLEPDTSDKPPYVNLVREYYEALPPAAMEQRIAALDANRIAQIESLQAVDEAVAALDQALAAAGISDRTAIFFTSDNGYLWGEHWLDQKLYPYEESVRVPLVMRLRQNLPVTLTDHRLVLNIDLAPTIADITGATVPGPIDGTSLGILGSWRQDFVLEAWNLLWLPTYQALRSRNWKYVRYEDGSEELYHLEVDPMEQENLLSTAPGDPTVSAQADAMEQRLDELLAP